MDKNNNNKSLINISLRSNINDLLYPQLMDYQKEDNIKYNLEYNLNSHGYRCDEFTNTHEGLHILFVGCSNTFGEGVKKNKLWTHFLYNQILKNNKVSGYYNLGICGSTIFEQIKNCYRYIRKYGTPDYIFMLLPEMERDHLYFKESRNLLLMHIVDIYKMFEDFCNSKNIKLISTTWVMKDNDFWKDLKEKVEDMPLTHGEYYTEDSFYSEFVGHSAYKNLEVIEKYSKTFKVLDENILYKNVYEFANLYPNDKNLYVAQDRNKHYGHAFHYAWYKYFYERFCNV
jgi:hypothetical protein